MKNFEIINTEKMLCHSCMEEHNVHTIWENIEHEYKHKKISYKQISYYCDKSDTIYMTEQMMTDNYYRMLKAYDKSIN